ncbi:MAG TPA: Ig-like domain-containing protein [Terriglobales bacterium]|nr:Ig-like domain-containing protein [Terriglobales bacterium]
MQISGAVLKKYHYGRWGNLFFLLFIVAALLICQACGGGSSSHVPVALGSIQITPANSLVPLAGTRQLKATGIFSDGSKQDLTASVTWTSASVSGSENYVTIDATGLATGVALGTSVINATLGPVLGVTQLTTNTNGYSSRTTAILPVPFQKIEVDAAYLPQSRTTNAQGVYTVQEVNLDAEQFSPVFPPISALLTSIPMPPGFVPNITAASQTSLKVLVASYNSPNIQVIDASNDSTDTASNTIIATFTSPISKTVTFNGITCMICGIVVNPATDQALLSTSQGYYTMDFNAGTFTALAPPAFPAENFLLNPVVANASFILSPTYGQDPNISGEVQIINLANNAVTTNMNLGIPTPSAAEMDLFTNVGLIVDSQSASQAFVNLGEIQNPTASTWTAPSTLVQITGGCNTPPSAMTMIALGVGVGAENQNHLIFSSQPSGNCVAVESLLPTAVPGAPDPTLISYAYGLMPNTPDGNAFVNGSDPNSIATFTSVYDKKNYGLLVSANEDWMAKIALQSFVNLNATNQTLPQGQSVILFAQTGQQITYLPTMQ